MGPDENSNVIVSSWGEELIADQSRDMCFSHDDIATRMGSLLTAPAVMMAGTRNSILSGPLARLERAMISYFLDFHIKRGYAEMSVPYIVSESTLEGTGQLPKFKEDLFHISNHCIGDGENAYLIPTAEVPVLATYRNEILSHDSLPLHHVCYTPCFRAESGSAGRDSKGLLRQHQFHKVELIKVCKPKDSQKEHLGMVKDVEELLQSLGLPHRRVLLSAGDTGNCCLLIINKGFTITDIFCSYMKVSQRVFVMILKFGFRVKTVIEKYPRYQTVGNFKQNA